ncbi:lipopolysaccharide biosynthesis protein [Streptosporangium sp. CA-135522]|uniref:lipopolysaccharide biosynthesis protein n=1 Tax=Streptosporangium sp. CA-135522 TaxID=3240072 RepID=UPI003D8E9D42
MTDTGLPSGAADRRGTPRALWKRVPKDLNDPLLRNAYSLIVNAGAAGALGLAYWTIAVRFYSEGDYGRASALIAAMRLLAALTAFGFVGALTRFLPEGGRATGRLVGFTYLVGGGAAAVATVLFLSTLETWGANFSGLNELGLAGWFLLSVFLWCVFTIQDVVLTALGKATWVPLIGIAVGLAKIGLLVVLAPAFPGTGIFLAWTIPVAVTVVPISIAVFGRLAPLAAARDPHRAPPRLRRIGRFLAGDFPGTLFILASVYLMPVLVFAGVDARTAGYYAAAVTLVGVFDMLALNMAISLTIEGSGDPSLLAGKCVLALRRTMTLLVPVVLTTVLAAPLILRLGWSPSFAEHGANVLRLLALASVPHAVIEIYLGVLRARSRVRALLALQALLCVLVVGLSFVLFRFHGITGVGLGTLAAQVVVVAVVAPGLISVLRGARAQAGRGTPVEAGRRTPVEAGLSPDETPTLVMMIVDAQPTLAAAPARTPPAETAPPARTRTPWPVSAKRWLPPLITVEGLVIVALAFVAGGSLTFPPATVPVAAGIGLVVVAFAAELAMGRRRPVLWTQLVAVTVCLHGMKALAGSAGDSAGGLAGKVMRIMATGRAPDGERLLALPAFLARAMGLTDPTALLNWAPVLLAVAALAPALLVARAVRRDERFHWPAAMLVAAGLWLAPAEHLQTSLFCLFGLCVLALALTPVRRRRPSGTAEPADDQTLRTAA